MVLFSIFTFTIILVIIGYLIGRIYKPFLVLLGIIIPLICVFIAGIGVLSFIASFEPWLNIFPEANNNFIIFMLNNPFLLQLFSIICFIICVPLIKITGIIWDIDFELDYKNGYAS